jgi:hypothetical protein
MAELLSKLEEEKDEPKTPSWPPRCGWWNNWCRGTGGKWKENKDEKGFVIFLKFRFVPYATAGLRVKTSVPLEHLFRHGRFDTATLPLFPPNWAQTFWYVFGISQTMSPTHQKKLPLEVRKQTFKRTFVVTFLLRFCSFSN